MAKVTMKEIARQLNLSPATVSLALNGRPGVNPETRRKVLALVRKLNYTGNTGGSKATTRNAAAIGFLIYQRYGKIITDSQFFTNLISAVERAARAQEYTLMLSYCMGEGGIGESLQLVGKSSLEGLLVLGTELSEREAEKLYRLDMPMVILDCDIYGCKLDTVTIHNEEGIWQGMRHLYEQGHRQVGYFRSSFPIRNFEQRFQGYEAALRHFGMEGGAGGIFMLDPSVEGACADICELIAQGVRFPGAILADNDLIALGAMMAFSRNGIRVPEDVSIVGFDDIPMAAIVEPHLTSVQVFHEALGEMAVDRLLWRRQHPEAAPGRLSVRTALSVRSSVSTKI